MTEELLRERLSELAKSLIDLSPRNPLLHSNTRRRILAVQDPPLEQLWTKLLENGERFLIVPGEWDDNSEITEKEKSFEARAEWLNLIKKARWSKYPRVEVSLPADRLFSNLKRLRRRVLTLYHDAGIWTLFLAFGLLRWTPGRRIPGRKKTEIWESPLFLVPVTLDQGAPGEPFLLGPYEDGETQLNPALLIYLQEIEKLSLPEIDLDTTAIKEAFEKIAETVKERGWKLEPVCWLNVFSFYKMAIYRDLTQNSERILTHPVIKAMLGADQVDLKVHTDIDKRSLDDRPCDEIATVLPADSSQLEAILRVRNGESLLIHGPPGTGKSQTIVNIISDAIRHGKSVLFVSEKRAALEVVLRRLRHVGLEPFCLDLHNYRIKRQEVIKSIEQELNSHLKTAAPSDRLLARLEQRRNALSEYVKAIHTPFPPLKRTPYQVIGRLSRLSLPPSSIKISIDVKKLTETKLNKIINLTQSLVPVVNLFREGPTFPWWGLKEMIFSDAARLELVEHVKRLEDAMRQVKEAIGKICQSLCLQSPGNMKQVYDFSSLIKEFNKLPSLPNGWIKVQDFDKWLALVKKNIKFLEDLNELQKRVSRFAKWKVLLSLSPQEIKRYQQVVISISSNLPKNILKQPLRFLLDRHADFKILPELLEKARCNADSLRDKLGLLPCQNLEDLQRTSVLAEAIAKGTVFEQRWFSRDITPQCFELYQQFVVYFNEKSLLQQRLAQEWDKDLFALEPGKAWETWKCWHGKLFRSLNPSYRSLWRHLKHAYRGKRLLPEKATSALSDLLRIKELEVLLEKLRKKLDIQGFLGDYYKNLETDEVRKKIIEALQTAKNIREAFPAGLPLSAQRILCGHEGTSTEILAIAKELIQNWGEGKELLCQLGLEFLEGNFAEGKPLGSVIAICRVKADAVEELYSVWGKLNSLLKETKNISLQDLENYLKEMHKVLEVNELYNKVTKSLATEWKWRPQDTPEAWNKVLKSLEVWQKVVSLMDVPEGTVPPSLFEVAQRPESRPSCEQLEQALREWEKATEAISERFESPFPKVKGTKPLIEASFQELEEHLRAMRDRIDEVQDYLDLQRLREALAQEISNEAVDALLNMQDLPTEKLPEVVERLILGKWLDHVFASSPPLREFRWERYQQYIQEFRELDAKLEEWAFAKTVQELNERRRKIIEDKPEVQLIRREARKKRRHLSVRKLIQRAFYTILEVKPCWLMSPLSVSYFLSPDHQFDLVIFDEASQVRPGDAIPAIYRAKQVVICGDPKQLPPTSFFEARILELAMSDEEMDEEEAYIPLGESVLESLEGFLPSVMLEWHYRSKDEKLIAFSNHVFYHGRLITFPTPQAPGRDTGIRYEYQPEAVYERSGRRINRKEVDAVCQLIEEHLMKWGTSRSLGVVTMNEPQKEAILDELERRGRKDDRFHVLWSQEGWPNGEVFFVKNLETVQGDERDVIIISTTYGKGTDGRLTLQFGPLTQSGGERRLNVLITRAREKIILVTSLQPEDIRLADGQGQDGLRVLRAYLRYARDGVQPVHFGKGSTPEQAFESDFEASVAEVLQSWGYKVIPQYGVGPYRIDLAVGDPLDPTRIQVGVECDGATYHRLPTVRERDRIRQEWLERQGWKIVRVWSTEWWYQRRKAEKRLRSELEEAFRKAREGKKMADRCPQTTRNKVKRVRIKSVDLRSQLLEEKKVEIYHPTKSDFYRGRPRIVNSENPEARRNLQDIDKEELKDLILIVAEVLVPCDLEYLMRQVANLLGFKRLGKRIRETLETAIRQLCREKALVLDPDREFVTKASPRK